jgi:hypothetical protein
MRRTYDYEKLGTTAKGIFPVLDGANNRVSGLATGDFTFAFYDPSRADIAGATAIAVEEFDSTGLYLAEVDLPTTGEGEYTLIVFHPAYFPSGKTCTFLVYNTLIGDSGDASAKLDFWVFDTQLSPQPVTGLTSADFTWNVWDPSKVNQGPSISDPVRELGDGMYRFEFDSSSEEGRWFVDLFNVNYFPYGKQGSYNYNLASSEVAGAPSISAAVNDGTGTSATLSLVAQNANDEMFVYYRDYPSGDFVLYPSSRRLWTAEDVDSLAWFDAQDQDTITEVAGDVSQWNDKSGNGRHLSQADSGKQPSYASDTITFNGLTDILVHGAAFMFANGESDVFVVLSGAAQEQKTIVGEGNDSNDTPEALWRTGISPRPERISARIRNDAGGVSAANVSSGTALDGTPHICWWSDNPVSGAVFGRVDGSNFSGFGWTRYTNVTLDNFTVGAHKDTTESQHAAVSIKEIVVCNNLSTEDRQKMEGYLAWKWGIEANLASDHPYKDEAPTVPPERVGSGDLQVTGLTNKQKYEFIAFASRSGSAVIDQSPPSNTREVFVTDNTTTFTDQRAALYDWASSIVPITFIWIPSNGPQPATPFGTIEMKPTEEIGHDYHSEPDDNGISTIKGDREYMFEVQIYGSISPTGEDQAHSWALDLQTSLQKRSVLDELKKFGIAYVDAEPITSLTDIGRTRYEARALLEVRFRIGHEETDTVGVIEESDAPTGSYS